ncbi:MAG: hypothetical protein GKR91_12545 [Pseudomonadales bacterium]|nr:hypothetical protein [Pseudomonadales bacterium]
MEINSAIIRNVCTFLGIGIAYNIWILIFDAELLPYFTITILNGVICYHLFVGSPLLKRALVATAPFCIVLYPIIFNEEIGTYVNYALAQMIVVGLLVVQLWEVFIWLWGIIFPKPQLGASNDT